MKNHMNVRKRFLSLALIFIMVLGLMPSSTFAMDQNEEATAPQVRGLPDNNPDLFITLKDAGNSSAFGIENNQGIFEDYKIGAVGLLGDKVTPSSEFRLIWGASLNRIGTSSTGRVIKITVPQGIEIKTWANEILRGLIDGSVNTATNADGSTTYTLEIKDETTVSGRFGQSTELSQDVLTIFDDYYPGKTYEFRIDYYTDEQATPLKTDTLVFKPAETEEAQYTVTNNLNDMQYAPDYVGDNYKLSEYSIFADSAAYAVRSDSLLQPRQMTSDYQTAIGLGKMYHTTSNSGTAITSAGSPVSRIIDQTNHGFYGGLKPYPGIIPAVIIDKSAGYLQKDMTITIPLPAYADGSTTSLKLYERQDGKSGFERFGTSFAGGNDGTCIYFQPDGTDELYCLPPIEKNSKGVYKMEFDAANEVVTVKMAPEQYLNSYYYIGGETSYMDLLAKPGKIYINLCLYADGTKLLNQQFLGTSAGNDVGKNHQIVAKDKTKITYTDFQAPGTTVTIESADRMTLNFHANDPKITFSTHLSKSANTIQEQSFNTTSHNVVEAAALSPENSSGLLSNWQHVGGAESKMDLGRGQTNIYFDYTYEQAYSPVAFSYMFNGMSHSANYRDYKVTNQNSTYVITITDAKTGAKRKITVDENWTDTDGSFSNQVTPAQLNLTKDEYVSNVRISNPIAHISGDSFAKNSTNSWGLFTARYRAKEKVYVGGVETTLSDGYVAKATVKYGSDQVAEQTLEEKVKLLKTYNNFTVGTQVDYSNVKSYGTIPVNDNSSVYTLYGFCVTKYADTMQYQEGNYPTITISGPGMELCDTLATDYSNTTTYEDANNYYRKAFIPISYVNQDGETVSLRGIDWSLAKYNLGTDPTYRMFIEKRQRGRNYAVRGYVLTDIFKENGDQYAKSVTLELNLNHIDASNASKSHDVNIWLAAHKIKPGYLNYDGVIGTNGKADIGEDWQDTTAKHYQVNIMAESSMPFYNYANGKAISGVTASSNHVMDKIYKNTYKIVYGVKNDNISVTNLDHELQPIDARWTGTDMPATQGGAASGALRPEYNVPFSGSGTQAALKERNKETALTEVTFDAQYSALKETLNLIPKANAASGGYVTVATRGPFDYKRIAFDFDGSDADLLALTNGFAVNTYGSYKTVSGIDVEYTTNNNATPQQKKLAGRVAWINTTIGEGYVYFDLRGLLQEGEYFTSLKLIMPEEWSEFISYNQFRAGIDNYANSTNASYRTDVGMPNIRLTRIGPLPKLYPVAGTPIGQNDDGFDEYDKLDVKCTMSYIDVFDSSADVIATGKSSRIVGQKIIVNELKLNNNKYTAIKETASDPSSATYQGGCLKWENSFYINYADGGALDATRKVKPVVYYKINSQYVPRLDSITIGGKKIGESGATASYIAPGTNNSGYQDYGILIVDFKDTQGMSQGYNQRRSLSCVMDVKVDAEPGNNVPVPEMWLDIPYDRDIKNNNLDNEKYDYTIEIAPVGKGGELNPKLYGSSYDNDSNSNYPGQLDDAGNGAVMLKADIPTVWNIMNYIVEGVKVKAISHYPYTYSDHAYSRDLTIATDDDPEHYLFQAEATLITPAATSQDWVVYVPVPNKDANNDFGMKLVGVDTQSLTDIGAKGIKLYYTNSESFTKNELAAGGTDTDYVEWSSGDPAELADATCLKVKIDEMPPDTRGRLLCSYKLDERKSAVGDQDATITVDVAYTDRGIRTNPFENADAENTLTYTLQDMTVTGSLWVDTNWDSIKDAGEKAKKDVEFTLLLEGAVVEQGPSATYKSDANGNFTLLAPREGEYQVKIKRPQDYVLVNKMVVPDTAIASWFDRNTEVVDAFELKADTIHGTYSFGVPLAGLAKAPNISINSDTAVIHVTDTHAGKIEPTVEGRATNTTLSFALKTGEPTDIATVHDLGDETADFDGLKTGVTKGTISIGDGYGGAITKDFDIIVYGQVKYNSNTGTGTVTDSGKYYPSVKADGSDAKTDEVTVQSGSDLSKTGYLFDGWNDKADGTGTPRAAGSTFQTGYITGDITLYAQWKPIEYEIVFDKNAKLQNGLPLHGTIEGTMTNQSMTYDAVGNLTTNAYSIDGYSFTGWNSEADGSGMAYADGASVKNLADTQGAKVTMYAQWRPHKYTITLDKNDVDSDGNPLVGTPTGTVPDKEMTYGKEDSLPTETYELTGYEFMGWEDADGNTFDPGQSVSNLSTADNATVTLKARWKIKSYVVEYQYEQDVSNQPEAPAKDSFKYNAEVAVAAVPTLEGYDFNGWSLESPQLLAIADNAFNMPASNVLFKGKWTAHTYTVHYDKNAGSATGTTKSSKHTYDEEGALTANGYTNPGFKFMGWATTPGGKAVVYSDGATIMSLSPDKDGEVTLYAVWEALPMTTSPANTPGTGDTNALTLWLTLLILSAMGVLTAGCLCVKFRKRALKTTLEKGDTYR